MTQTTSELILSAMVNELDMNVHEIRDQSEALGKLKDPTIREQLKRLTRNGFLIKVEKAYGRTPSRYIHADNYVLPPPASTLGVLAENLSCHKPEHDMITSARWCNYTHQIGFC